MADQGPQTNDKAPPANHYASVAFEIEFATKQNNKLACPITKREYRGRWEMVNIKNRVPDDRFAGCPTIPGHRIRFDGKNRRVQFIDPLGTQEFRDTLKELKKTLKEWNGSEGDPDDSVSYEKLDDDKLKQWCYWARRWFDQGAVEKVAGKIPEMDELGGMPGRVERNTFDTNASRDKFPDEVPPYMPPVKTAKV